MIEPIKIILLMFFIVDMFLTYYNITQYRKLYPKKDYSKLELNPLPRFFWRKFGLLKGGIIATTLQFLLLMVLFSYTNRDIFLILIGFYLMVLITHVDTMTLIRKRISKKVRFPNWRKYVTALLFVLTILDLLLTGIYLNSYKEWQPDRPLDQMESNRILLFFMDIFGINLGLFFASLITLSLMYLVGKKADWYVCVPVTLTWVFAIIINSIHLNQLYNLIKFYPLGYIP